MLFSRDQAKAFFTALRKVSVEFMQHHGLPEDQGRKRYAAWKEGYPVGVTEHFTGGVSWKTSVRWLNGSKNRSSSCQMLILDRMTPEYRDIISRYSTLRELQVAVILMSDGIIPCWHAGWVNRYNFGIENRNAGALRYDGEDWHWWARNWTAKFPVEGLGKTPVNIDGIWREPYTFGQLHANVYVCQMLYCLYPIMDPRWFLPHSATTASKSDVGPAYPLRDVRDAVFDQEPVHTLSWLHNYKADPQYMDDYDEEEDEKFLDELNRRQVDRLGSDEPYDFAAIDEIPDSSLQLLVEEGNWRTELPAIRRALNLLGYRVPASRATELDEDTSLAVWMFQKSHKQLVADRIPGSKTQLALAERLRQFRLHIGKD